MNPSAIDQPTDYAVIAFGSNLGDGSDQIRRAMDAVENLACGRGGLIRSSLWESTPMDCPAGSPRFINAVAAFLPQPDETPEHFLTHLQELEIRSGRKRKGLMNEPRPLDLDIITWRGLVRSTPTLILPHPRAHMRQFVLQPLAEILPDLILPGQKREIRRLIPLVEADPDLRRLIS